MSVGNGTVEPKAPAKAAHVNMMTDTVIANMAPEGLRAMIRGMLGGNAQITANFYELATQYLVNTKPASIPELFTKSANSVDSTPALQDIQRRYRCLMGCGFGYESMELLTEVLRQLRELEWDQSTNEGGNFFEVLELVDGDIVQAVTAIHKSLLTSSGVRKMTCDEVEVVRNLKEALDLCQETSRMKGQNFAFERGLSCFEKLLKGAGIEFSSRVEITLPPSTGFVSSDVVLESIKLGCAEVPRMFMGLWQFSSPSWGTASRAKIDRDFRKHVDVGLIAYDMADHYGDAEVTFGQFRSAQPDAEKIYCATKWAVFEPIKITKETVDANIKERLAAINATKVELLQFHWQDYEDHQYVQASRLLEEHPQVSSLGLCNFDAQHMEEIVESGVKVVSNQVQFSLIDLRPTFRMAAACQKHGVKLLTYGSLCGGFLADKWLGQPAPNMFEKQMTPSHRKYFEMISIWGGWSLFQELLSVLAAIGKKYNASISSVAIRWVLDHEYVGAVIIGARMGISEHVEENLQVFSFKLDQEDKNALETVLSKCRAKDIFEEMGDCGAEYRQ
ncbi:aldo/keto reductase-like protein [Halenospora varia]|nr:aldo/keto reductase-like protein [Halenospora varia]